MAGGVTLAVRQIGSYPAASPGPGDLLLMQPGGLGNPYASVDAAQLVAEALRGGPALGVGTTAPPNADGAQIFTGTIVYPYPGLSVLYNLYVSPNGLTYLGGGLGGAEVFENGEFAWQSFPPGPAGGLVPPGSLSTQMLLTVAGQLILPLGTVTVARDPAAAMEVATMGWVGNNTVASFNGRKGVVQLTSADIYGALCLDSCIATENWVNGQIQSSIQLLLANHPFVFGWNGRTGAVYLTLADISCVFFQPGQQPITQTPPLTSNDYSIPNTAWVVEYIANEFAGGGTTLATQAWVLANTVNSFNGRQGIVTLTASDVFDVGAAPLNSPNFSGIPSAPTAAVGQATGQIATTAFVQQAISANTAGVSTFNTRSGDVVLETADVTAVGGLTNPSPNLLGNPTAPTQPPGTNLPVIATCEFVQAALTSGAVTSFNTRTGAVTLTLADITGVGGAPLVSPTFSSVPTAPTAAPGTNTVQLATCAFVTAALNAAGGVSSFNGRTGAVDLIGNDISAAGGLVNPSVGLTGSPTATTATAGDNSTRIATTAFVQTALSSGAVSSFNTRTGAVTLQGADITAAGGALLASPAFTGAPTAPTAAPATNNTQIATTAYVTAAILADTTGVTSFNTRTGAISLLLADITGAGGAPLASPSFTGVPLGPTATAGTSTTQLATTAFVQAAIASSGVSSFNARTGAVTLIANDISAAGGALLASPTFTGVPAAPTAAPGNNSTQLATTAFVVTALAGIGGPFLPLTGGTLTGGLSGTTGAFSGNLSSGGSFTLPGPIVLNGNNITGGTNLITLTAGTVNLSNNVGIGGTLTTSAGGTIGGNLSVTGTTITLNGNVITGGTNAISFSSSTATFANNVTVNGQLTGLNDLWAHNGNCRVGNNGVAYNSLGFGNYNGLVWNGTNAFVFVDGTNEGSINGPSDANLKENFGPVGVDCLAAICRIGLQSYDWKPSTAPPRDPDGNVIAEPPRLRWQAGYIAQDIQAIIPEAIIEQAGAPLSVDDRSLLAYLIGAVQQLSAEVASLKGAA